MFKMSCSIWVISWVIGSLNEPTISVADRWWRPIASRQSLGSDLVRVGIHVQWGYLCQGLNYGLARRLTGHDNTGCSRACRKATWYAPVISIFMHQRLAGWDEVTSYWKSRPILWFPKLLMGRAAIGQFLPAWRCTAHSHHAVPQFDRCLYWHHRAGGAASLGYVRFEYVWFVVLANFPCARLCLICILYVRDIPGRLGFRWLCIPVQK